MTTLLPTATSRWKGRRCFFFLELLEKHAEGDLNSQYGKPSKAKKHRSLTNFHQKSNMNRFPSYFTQQMHITDRQLHKLPATILLQLLHPHPVVSARVPMYSLHDRPELAYYSLPLHLPPLSAIILLAAFFNSFLEFPSNYPKIMAPDDGIF